MIASPKISICQHRKECGSCCDLEMSYETHLNHKLERLRASFQDFSVEIGSCLPSPKNSNYRLKVQLPFGMERDNKKTRVTLGCFAPGTHKVVDQQECSIQDQDLNEAVQLIRKWAQSKHLPVYNEQKGTGVLRYLLLRKSKAYGEILIGLICAQELKNGRKLADELIDFIRENQKRPLHICGIVLDINTSEGNRVLSGNEHLLWGTASLKEKIGDLDFELGLSTFFQINTHQIPTLYNAIMQETPEGAQVLELFSGTGSISLWLASKARSVLGIEINRSSVLSAQRSATLNGIHNVKFECGDASRAIAFHPLGAFDSIVVDPPRRGLGAEILQSILSNPVEKILYVSCNVDSLIKDLKQLESAYIVEKVLPVDMFPYTPHVETVTVLRRRNKQ